MKQTEKKLRVFSGIQPSGDLHIGNYLGAIKQWVGLQDDHDALFCIVDLHAITVPQVPDDLRRRTLEIAKIYCAAGIDPDKATLFVQSHVSAHAELGWILNTITQNGDLTKMTQFKDKSGVDADQFEEDLRCMIDRKAGDIVYRKIAEISKEKILETAKAASYEEAAHSFHKFKEGFNSVGVGLFDYPVLMAADILLYGTHVVPVGDDQVQHIELTRDLAKRFNHRFGETFVIPQARVGGGKRIMGLDNPAKKMSKSAHSTYNYIALADDPDIARKKIMKAVTDSGSDIVYSDEKPALKNLLTIFSLLTDENPDIIASRYDGKGYAAFKQDLADVVATFLVDFQRRLNALDDASVMAILARGKIHAQQCAEETMARVRERVGFIPCA